MGGFLSFQNPPAGRAMSLAGIYSEAIRVFGDVTQGEHDAQSAPGTGPLSGVEPVPAGSLEGEDPMQKSQES